MTRHHDRIGLILHDGDLVRVGGITGELFRIKYIRLEGDAVIENVLPGGRLGTSSVPCRDLTKAIGNPVGKPPWFDDTYEPYRPDPVPFSVLPCGCFLRAFDLQAVLCERHLLEVNR